MGDPTTWQVWTQLLIPLAGVLASTAVAIAAVVTARRATEIAERSHKESMGRDAAADRLHFSEQLSLNVNASVMDASVPSLEQIRRLARSTENGAPEIVAWWEASEASHLQAKMENSEMPKLQREWSRINRRRLDATLMERLEVWVADQDGFDLTPWDPVRPDAAAGGASGQ